MEKPFYPFTDTIFGEALIEIYDVSDAERPEGITLEDMDKTDCQISFYGTIQKMRDDGDLASLSDKVIDQMIYFLRFIDRATVLYESTTYDEFDIYARVTMEMLMIFDEKYHIQYVYGSLSMVEDILVSICIEYADKGYTVKDIVKCYSLFCLSRYYAGCCTNKENVYKMIHHTHEMFTCIFPIYVADRIGRWNRIWDEWDMDTEEEMENNTSYIQWLPREKVEDMAVFV